MFSRQHCCARGAVCNLPGLTWQVPAISCKELQELLNTSDSVVLVDVRTPDEQSVSVLPGNVVRKEEFEQHPLAYADSTIVTYWYGVPLYSGRRWCCSLPLPFLGASGS